MAAIPEPVTFADFRDADLSELSVRGALGSLNTAETLF